jgi:hypothetical protein
MCVIEHLIQTVRITFHSVLLSVTSLGRAVDDYVVYGRLMYKSAMTSASESLVGACLMQVGAWSDLTRVTHHPSPTALRWSFEPASSDLSRKSAKAVSSRSSRVRVRDREKWDHSLPNTDWEPRASDSICIYICHPPYIVKSVTSATSTTSASKHCLDLRTAILGSRVSLAGKGWHAKSRFELYSSGLFPR